MNIVEIYHRQKEKLQNIRERGKERGYTTYAKLTESLNILEDRLKKKQEQMDQLDKEIRVLEKEIEARRTETESRQEKRERLYGQRSEEIERTQFNIKFMETFFFLDEEKDNENDEDIGFDKTNEKEIRKMLDKKYTVSELKDEVYYFFRANVFGLGRNIVNAKERKCILTNHDTGEEFEFTLKNKDGSTSSRTKESADKSKDELVTMYAFVIRNINKDCKKHK